MPIRNSKTPWAFPSPPPVPGLFQAAVGGSSLVSRTLHQRGYTDLESALAFLDPDRYQPAPPAALPGLSEAASRLETALQRAEQVLIWGDFDVDGQTSTTLLSQGLKSLGGSVCHYIPVRAAESHGIGLDSLQAQIARCQPGLILTCDTGIDAVVPVQYARQAGIDVIITDHHTLPADLPPANAIVNPNFLDESHPLSNLPGVGVAYKLIEEIFSRHALDPAPLLDLVALGIVADVALQIGDNRYLLQRGLQVLRSTPRLGLQALCRLSGITPQEISEEQIGFAIAPRLNALGRLDDANSCVEFLTTKEPGRAEQLAQFLDDLNRRRQDLTERIFQESLARIDSETFLVEDFPVLVLDGPPSWEPGVIGIVASRLVERFGKPVIMLSRDGESFRGSARSISGVNITELIGESSPLLDSYGGHPMAAGLSLPEAHVANFRRSLGENYARLVGDQPQELPILIDSELSFQDVTQDFVRDFQRLAPFGAGNPKLLFATRGATVVGDRVIGKNENHRKITCKDPMGADLDLLWWNSADQTIPGPPLDVAFTLDLTTFNGQQQVQATLQHIRRSPEAPVYLPDPVHPAIVDCRLSPHPLQDLNTLTAEKSPLIWAEFTLPPDHPSFPRSTLSRNADLVIWTLPPSRYDLKQVLTVVSPVRIYLFSNDPSFSDLTSYLEALLGLLKHLRSANKEYDAVRFAQALAVTTDVIEVGLEWLHLHGDLDLGELKSSGQINRGSGTLQPGFDAIDHRLKSMLRELVAYRTYFKNAPTSALL